MLAAALCLTHEDRARPQTAQECLAAGVELDTSSSAALHASLQAVKQRNSELGDVRASRPSGRHALPRSPHALLAAQVAMYMLTNPMKPAVYFVAGKCEPEDWRHYALNIPYYTHFTSPIRRYADVMVRVAPHARPQPRSRGCCAPGAPSAHRLAVWGGGVCRLLHERARHWQGGRSLLGQEAGSEARARAQ